MLRLFKILGMGEEEREIEHFKKYEEYLRADKIRKTQALQKWASAVKERDGYICQRCFRNKRRMYAHHIIGLWKDPNKAFLLENGKTLCLFCHMIEDVYFEKRMLSNLYKTNDKDFDADILRYIEERKKENCLIIPPGMINFPGPPGRKSPKRLLERRSNIREGNCMDHPGQERFNHGDCQKSINKKVSATFFYHGEF